MFAVFGVSKEYAKVEAVKITPIADDFGQLGLDDYTNLLERNTEKLFKKLKPTQLSCLYTDQKVAATCLKLLEKDGARDLFIKQKINDPQNKRTKAGHIKTVWC